MQIITNKIIKEALLIRAVEEAFLELFSQGKLNGTVHTCIGQEFSALAFAGQLQSTDFIFSNHRCHGHYLAFTKDYEGLIAELMGKRTGMCAGIGSSQHICKHNFYSNGIQGGIVPVATGLALANKLRANNQIGLVFIGEGTLGEGVVYESFNIAAKMKIPIIFVCENNFYSQSTAQELVLAGDIIQRAQAFGITKTFEDSTDNPEALFQTAKEAINFTRANMQPSFCLVKTARLKAHSKGDDDRDQEIIQAYLKKDFLENFKDNHKTLYKTMNVEINDKVQAIIAKVSQDSKIHLDDYYKVNTTEVKPKQFSQIQNTKTKQVVAINNFFYTKMKEDKELLFIGEDVLDPYGGAFKVSKGLSSRFPDQVLSTPISEAGITGLANGLSLAGMKPFLEIMFGDFITLAFDQILNHASKFHHMYFFQKTCPIVIRTPMGGKRGYGPTHSQSLDKFLLGIDNVKVLALNYLLDPKLIYEGVYKEPHPSIVLEHKTDYAKKVGGWSWQNFEVLVSDDIYPLIHIKPKKARVDLTIISYGGALEAILKAIEDLFLNEEVLTEVLVLSQIHPISTSDYNFILKQLAFTKKLAVVEEGSSFAGFGSELLASLQEQSTVSFKAKRISGLNVPIPSVKTLEQAVIPNAETIVREITKGLL